MTQKGLEYRIFKNKIINLPFLYKIIFLSVTAVMFFQFIGLILRIFRYKFVSKSHSTEVPAIVTQNSINKSVEVIENLSCEKFGKVVLRRRVYSRDPDCKSFLKCLYAENTFEQIPLVSFPGSGNTWIRHLIELASGIYTGSIYTDVDLLARGFFGEKEAGDAGSTIVQKMHVRFSKELNVSKAILLMREPYKAIISFVQYLESGHLGQAALTTFRKKEWNFYVLGKTYEWISIAKSWIEAPVDLLVVHYENFHDQQQLHYEVGKICRFLKIQCDNLHTNCFSKYKEGLFHRKGSLTKPSFSKWVRKKVDAGINYLNSRLLGYGLEGIPLTKYHTYQKNLTNKLSKSR